MTNISALILQCVMHSDNFQFKITYFYFRHSVYQSFIQLLNLLGMEVINYARFNLPKGFGSILINCLKRRVDFDYPFQTGSSYTILGAVLMFIWCLLLQFTEPGMVIQSQIVWIKESMTLNCNLCLLFYLFVICLLNFSVNTLKSSKVNLKQHQSLSVQLHAKLATLFI